MPGILQSIRESREMPFLKRGMRCNMDGEWGYVVSATGSGLKVRFDGMSRTSYVHPTWEMTYYDSDGSIIKDYKKEAK